MERAGIATSSGSASTRGQVEEEEDAEKWKKHFFPKKKKTANSAESELLRYLADPNDSLECLPGYPRVLQVFRKYNTVLPSSAAVERLFSSGKFIFRKNRHSLKDDSFEMHLLLNVNCPDGE